MESLGIKSDGFRFAIIAVVILLIFSFDSNNNLFARLGLENINFLPLLFSLFITKLIYKKNTGNIVLALIFAFFANIPYLGYGLGISDPDILAAVFLTYLMMPIVEDNMAL